MSCDICDDDILPLEECELCGLLICSNCSIIARKEAGESILLCWDCLDEGNLLENLNE